MARWLDACAWAAGAGILCLLAACDQPVTHHPIRFAIAQAPLTLDPRYATDAASERVNRLLYRPLVDFDAHSRPVPALATWQQTDATHYRFLLGEQGRTFHDGSRLTARDVVATYRSLLTLKDSPHSAEFANIAEVRAQGDDGVGFTLHGPDTDFPAKLIIGILPAALIQQRHDFARQPVGSGAFKLISWQRKLVLQRMADGRQLVLEEVKDPTVRVLKLLRGEADLLQGDLSPELVAYLKRQPQIKVLEAPGSNYAYLGFNLQDPVLKNPLVRQALALAINRDAMIQYAVVGGTRAATAILPAEHWAGNPDLRPYPYNPQRARALLQQAGVKLPLKLVYKTSTDAQRVRLATIMQAQLREAGIALEIRSLDWGTFFDDVKHGQFQLYGLTWVGIKTPQIYVKAFHSGCVPPKGFNRGRLRDAALDALLDKQDWRGATVRIHEQLPLLPLWYEGQVAAMRKSVAGYVPAADGQWDALIDTEVKND